MNRDELQQLSNVRINEARALLAAQQWAGAYYLAGYALESALKSCVLAYIERTGPDIIFRDKKFSERCWTHDIEQLVRLAELSVQRDRDADNNLDLKRNWLTAKDWSESSRYKISTRLQAEKLFSAIADPTNGVISWVQDFW